MYYYLIIIIFVIQSIYGFIVDLLQYKSLNRKIPENVSEVYDENSYTNWKAYKKEHIKLDFIKSLFYFVIVLSMFVFKLFRYLEFTDNDYTNIVSLLLIYITFQTLIDALIFNNISEFKIEKKYGFSNITKKTYIIDQIKNYIITIIITLGLTLLYKVLFDSFNNYVVLIFGPILIVIILVINFISPLLIRIFNKLTPLESGELREELERLLKTHGYQVKDILVMDGSKRSSKANAMFTGMGKQKTIILYDTIIEKMTPRELAGVFSHELGHGKHHDIVFGFFRMILLMVAFIGFIYFISVTNEIYLEFGFDKPNFGFGMIILTEVVIEFLSPLISLFGNYFSRKQEYNADKFACSCGYGEELVSALIKLTRNNYGDLNPHPLLVKLYYSHPTLSQRIDNIKANMNN